MTCSTARSSRRTPCTHSAVVSAVLRRILRQGEELRQPVRERRFAATGYLGCNPYMTITALAERNIEGVLQGRT